MKRSYCLFCLGFLALSSLVARGDGKMYWALEEVPAHIPYQRALILFEDGKQTLVLQSRVETEDLQKSAAPLAWVVPVPSVPELDSFPAAIANHLFAVSLNIKTPANIIPLRWVCYCIALLASVVWVFSCIGSRSRRRHLGLAFVVFLVLWLFPAVFMPAVSSAGAGVEVVDSKRVGIYETQVIRSDNSAALLEWLTENGFDFSSEDLPVLDRYVERGWCFVVSKVGVADAEAHSVNGLIDPLVMRFASESPVYPLALTATQGQPTQVLVYLLTDRKMVTESQLKLRYASDKTRPVLPEIQAMSIFQPWEKELTYLHRFRSRMSPEQMRADAVFVPAGDDKPVQETVWRW